jgi:hypothetical protein
MITIYQIQMTNAQIDAFNAGQSVPAIEAKRKLMFGSSKFTPDMLKYFTPVYEVETDDLEHAFELTNLWNNGHLVRALPGTRGHSGSVGDVFRKGDRFFMVDSFGFEELRLFNDEVEMLEVL